MTGNWWKRLVLDADWGHSSTLSGRPLAKKEISLFWAHIMYMQISWSCCAVRCKAKLMEPICAGHTYSKGSENSLSNYSFVLKIQAYTKQYSREKVQILQSHSKLISTSVQNICSNLSPSLSHNKSWTELRQTYYLSMYLLLLIILLVGWSSL